jgi:hypothetical protein
LTAENKKPHTIGETLLLPAAIKMYESMHGETDWLSGLNEFNAFF